MRPRLRVVVGATVAAMAAAATASIGEGQSSSAPAKEDQRVVAAQALAGEPAPDREATPAIKATQARRAADARSDRIPLPIGGNFNGIRWEQAQGMLSAAEIEGVLQYNAVCQWLRAETDGTDSAAAGVLDTVTSWPSLRGTQSDDVVALAIAEGRAGGGETYWGALSDCRASHAREIDYALWLGLPASK